MTFVVWHDLACFCLVLLVNYCLLFVYVSYEGLCRF